MMRNLLLLGLVATAAACSDSESEPHADAGPITDSGAELTPCEDFCTRMKVCFADLVEGELGSRVQDETLTCHVQQAAGLPTCTQMCETSVATTGDNPAGAVSCRDCVRAGLPLDCSVPIRGLCAPECYGRDNDFFEEVGNLVVFGTDCWPGGTTEPPAVCTDPRFQTQVEFEIESDPAVLNFDFDGRAEVRSIAPIRLALVSGATITLEIPAEVVPPLSVGEIVNTKIKRICPDSCSIQDALIEGIDGSLRLAAWSLPDLANQPPDPLQRRLAPSPCTSIRIVRPDDCYHRLVEDLVVMIDETEVRVPSGMSQTHAGYTVHNFTSTAFFGVTCTDTDNGRTRAAITGPQP